VEASWIKCKETLGAIRNVINISQIFLKVLPDTPPLSSSHLYQQGKYFAWLE